MLVAFLLKGNMRQTRAAACHRPRYGLPQLGNEYFSHVIEENGGARRDRTDDLVNAIHALSQLSYGPTLAARAKNAQRAVSFFS